jgi:hypothetical protein
LHRKRTRPRLSARPTVRLRPPELKSTLVPHTIRACGYHP